MTAATSTLALGCLVLFLLPFAATGIVTAGLGVQHAADENWGEALLHLFMGIVFCAVGFGGVAAALAAKRKLKDQEKLEARYPTQPWLWRQDWASGRVEDASRGAVVTAWIVAGFWNLVSFPAALVVVSVGLRDDNDAALVVLVLPIVGIGLLVRAIHATARHRKYGASRLNLTSVPVSVGRTLAGTVTVPNVVEPPEGFQATLSCIRRVIRGSGRSRSTTEHILWQEEQRVQGTRSREVSGMVTNVPVAFRIPADAKVTDSTNARDCVLWKLRLTATVPGVDYDSSFEVPVFRTAESEQPLTEEEERLAPDLGAAARQPPNSRIVVTTNRRGTEIIFPAARNPGAATGLTMFTLLWGAAILFQIYLDVPVLLPIASGVLGIMLTFAALDLWLGVSHVTVDAGSLSIASGFIFPSRTRRLSATEISDVQATMGMRAGTTPYYDITIVRKDGKKIKAARGVRDKREAEWLASTIKDALAL